MTAEERRKQAEDAVKTARRNTPRGDRSPASTFGQQGIALALVAVAESNLAIAEAVADVRAVLSAATKTYRTKSGRVLNDDDIQALADEAERGYDVDHLKAKSEATHD